MSDLLHELIFDSASLAPQDIALIHQDQSLSYEHLARHVQRAAMGWIELGIVRADRIAIYLEKRTEAVVAAFSAAYAGCVFVPINPLLKAEQVAYILQDCNVSVLVTSPERLEILAPALRGCVDLHSIALVGTASSNQSLPGRSIVSWADVITSPTPHAPHRVIDTDMVAILYTSGSTGKPKGVVLSHRNMVAGAKSVAQYLENHRKDCILSALPLSFDAGFSQLTTAFSVGARVVLINYLLPRDIVSACDREGVTGLTAVPPLWIQLAQLKWPEAVQDRLRYIANTGGHMPRATLDLLRASLPKTKPYLMYGLTESFRSTYLPPTEVDRRPDSIGKAIPNAEVMVVRPDGTPCAPNEEGELVHRGALVSLGYWNDPEKTAERFKPAPGKPAGLTMPEIAVWSGDTVRMDEDGYIYFVSRRDEMIKTSGYRVSPTEVEEVVYSSKLAHEVAAIGVPHPVLGQAIVVVATAPDGEKLDTEALLARCREALPQFMVPSRIVAREGSLPRNPNGKIDRKLLAVELQQLYSTQT